MLVDFQNDFCVGMELGGSVHSNAATAQRANEFAKAAAQLGAHVVYSQEVLDPASLSGKQRRWEHEGGLCAKGSPGAELYIDPVPGSSIITKNRFDIWQSEEFTDLLRIKAVDGLIIAGVELSCCVLFAVLGAKERGYHYIVPQDLVSGLDSGDTTYNQAVRNYLRFTHDAPETASVILDAWRRRLLS
ncbi:MAG: cysteine hydrolase family protein [Streptosporangiaceae bacterium]